MPSTTSLVGSTEPLRPAGLEEFVARLGYCFVDGSLLLSALAHRSWCAEHGGRPSNERLEFLGDSVLGLVVTDHLFRTYPRLSEGELAKLRAAVVSAPALADAARELQLGEVILLGKGEAATGGREKPSILADAMEAVIGAVYLDGGTAACTPVVLDRLGDRITEAAVGPGAEDHKTMLQELAARRFEGLPRYQVTDEGPDHEKRFTASVELGGRLWGSGMGRSKKQAEQDAARVAWAAIETQTEAFEAESQNEDADA